MLTEILNPNVIYLPLQIKLCMVALFGVSSGAIIKGFYLFGNYLLYQLPIIKIHMKTGIPADPCIKNRKNNLGKYSNKNISRMFIFNKMKSWVKFIKKKLRICSFFFFREKRRKIKAQCAEGAETGKGTGRNFG